MPCLPISYENLAATSTSYDPSKPVFMLNLWKFRPTAYYLPQHSALAGTPCTGKEALERYRASIQPMMPPNAAPWFISNVVTNLVAPKDEDWDAAAIVRYDSLEGFRKMVECEEYREKVEPHRLAALEDFKVIMLDQVKDL